MAELFFRFCRAIGTHMVILFHVVLALSSNEGAHYLRQPLPEIHDKFETESLLRRQLREDHFGYAPSAVDCPNPRPTIRDSDSVSSEEANWLETRRNNTIWALRDFLSRANIKDFDSNGYMDKVADNATALPNIGIAISGGGWRAHMNGAGAIAAFDNSTTDSTSAGHVGGILQAATYITGLSGGAWVVGSLYIPQLKTVQDLYRMDPSASDSLWQFDNSILKGPTALSITDYYDQMTDEVDNKQEAGFNTTLTDIWGRSLSFQLFNAIDGGPNYTFSSLVQSNAFQSAQVPLPIIVAIERPPNQLFIPANSSIYEINPWEIGSFDPPTKAFAPLRYIGSTFDGGFIPEDGTCILGFDNIGFVVGTSSSLFNQGYLQINKTDAPERIKEWISGKLEELGNDNMDVSYWVNPFYQFNPEENTNAQEDILPLVDGGEDLQNIPLHPLLQPVRGVDVIFAVDSSADTRSPGGHWPNGTALIATYQRSLLTSGHGAPFPAIPDQNTFVNLGLNSNPTFFGCDANNLTQSTPLIVYIPNSPYTYDSNITTVQMETNDTERNAIIQNGYNVATRGNGTLDNEWASCVGCAMLARSFWKTQTEIPPICQNCFSRYCWNGTTNTTAPSPYEPTHAIKKSECANGAGLASAAVLASLVSVLTLWL